MADPGDHTHDDQPEEDQSRPERARLMHEVAEQMDAIEANFGDSFEIGRVITLVEVRHGDQVELRVRANMYPWVAAGMLEWAKSQVIAASAE
jgi:hypothetical protein